MRTPSLLLSPPFPEFPPWAHHIHPGHQVPGLGEDLQLFLRMLAKLPGQAMSIYRGFCGMTCKLYVNECDKNLGELERYTAGGV